MGGVEGGHTYAFGEGADIATDLGGIVGEHVQERIRHVARTDLERNQH